MSIKLFPILLALVLACSFVWAAECNDGLDNDGDGCIDYGQDPFDCSHYSDDTESGSHCTDDYPIDPYLYRQWYLKNEREGSSYDDDIDGVEAWGVETGSPDVVVAVLSTGVDVYHADLRNKIWENNDPVDDVDNDGNGFVDDFQGWDFYNADNDPSDSDGVGSAMAGLIAAETNNIVQNLYGAGRTEWVREREENFGGVTLSDDYYNYYIMVNEDDHNVYRAYMSNPYTYNQIFESMSPNPQGITFKDGNFWFSDSSTDSIYERGVATQGVMASAVRITTTELQEDQIGYYFVDYSEIEIYSDGTNIATGPGVTASANREGIYYTQPEDVIDGYDTTYFMVEGQETLELTITLPSLQEIDEIVWRSWTYAPVDFTVEYYDGGNWVLVDSVVDNPPLIREKSYDLTTDVVEVLTSFSSPANEPRGLDFDGLSFWVADAGTDTIYNLTTSGSLTSSYALPCSPWGVSSNQQRIYVTCSDTKRSLILDYNTGDVIYDIPSALVYNYDNPSDSIPKGVVWLDDSNTHAIQIDDGSSNPSLIPTHSSAFLVRPDPYSSSDEGIAGLCQECLIMPIRVASYSYSGVSSGIIAEAVEYAVDNGADIVVFGFLDDDPYDSIEGVIDQYKDDVVFIAPAGSGDSVWEIPPWPGRYESVLTVGGTTSSDYLDPDSRYNSRRLKWIDMAAPSNYVYSTRNNDAYSYNYDTRMAASLVAGSAGLLKSYRPSWSPDRIISQLLLSTDGIDGLGYTYEPIDDEYLILGTGRLNAHSALVNPDTQEFFLRSFDVNDIVGNRDGFLQAGETAYIDFTVRNIGAPSTSILASLSTTHPGVNYYRNDITLDDLDRLDYDSDRFLIQLDDSYEYDNYIVFELELSADGGFSQVLLLNVSLPMEHLPGFPISSPTGMSIEDVTSADIDGDGEEEFVARVRGGGDARIVLYDKDGSIDWMSDYLGSGFTGYGVAVGNFDDDNKLEIFTGYSFEGFGSVGLIDDDGSLLWNNPLDRYVSGYPSIADIDGDGDQEIIFSVPYYVSDEYEVYVLDKNGNPVSGFNPLIVPVPEEDSLVVRSILAGDIDSDSNAEIFLLDSQGRLYGFDHNANTLSSFPLDLTTERSSTWVNLAFADVGDVGDIEVLVPFNRTLYAVNADASIEWSQEICSALMYMNNFHMTVGDVVGDDRTDVVIGCSGWTYDYGEAKTFNVIGSGGSWTQSCWDSQFWYYDETFERAEHVLVDINADGKDDIMMKNFEEIQFYQENCEQIPLEVGYFPYSEFYVTDIEGDGVSELVIFDSNRINAFTPDIPFESDWPMFTHDIQRTFNSLWSFDVTRCTDGTAYGVCSTVLPQYCNEGELVNNCNICGCPANKVCVGGTTCVRPSGSKYNIQEALPSGGRLRR